MFEHEDQLIRLRQEVSRRTELRQQIRFLETEHKTLTQRLDLLKEAAEHEQGDVDQLEGFTLKSIFYNMTGQKEDLLEKERREAYAAWLEHDAVATKLDEVTDQLAADRRECDSLFGCEGRYLALLEEILASQGDCTELREELCARLETERNELTETGSLAIVAKEMGLNVLESLKNLSTLNEQFSGTARNASMDGQLQTIQGKLGRFQEDLEIFNRSLREQQPTAHLVDAGALELYDEWCSQDLSHGSLAEQIARTEQAVKDARRKLAEHLEAIEEISRQKLLRQLALQKK